MANRPPVEVGCIGELWQKRSQQFLEKLFGG